MDSEERGTLIRVPATANLMLDSLDRDTTRFPFASNFFITKNASIMNGFFNRIATAEVVLEWSVPNVSADLSNNTFQVQVAASTFTITLPDNTYDVESLLTAIEIRLNSGGGAGGLTWTLDTTYAANTILTADGAWTLLPGALQGQLGMPSGAASALGGGNFGLPSTIPDLRPYRYLDIVSEQLTYNQDLKDDSTLPNSRSVLCRWYFAWDVDTDIDNFGYPILMGYTNFCARRVFNPPKQIKWDRIQPIGQVSFEVYPDGTNVTAPNTPSFDWLMTLQVSEN
jgi:hypothetical protein